MTVEREQVGTEGFNSQRLRFGRRILILSSVTISITTSLISILLVFGLQQDQNAVLPVLIGSLIYLIIPVLFRVGLSVEIVRDSFFAITFAVVLLISLDPAAGVAFGFISYLPIFVCVAGMLYSLRGLLVIAGLATALVVSIAILDITRLPNVRTVSDPGEVIMIATRQGYAILFSTVLVIVAMRLFQDMLARMREARDEARRISESKTAFLANVSHEVRTPLNAILGMAEILKTTELTAGQRRKIETISHSGGTLLELLNDVLDVSRLEANQMPVTPSAQSLSEIFDGLHRLWAPMAQGKGLTLRLSIEPGVPDRVMVDAQRLRQCVTNLISNAIKFTSDGEVSVSVRAEPHESGDTKLIIDVTDTGIGMSADAADRVFRAFGQADEAISKSFGGTGLGLTITRQLARLMGGDLRFKSLENSGTVFTLTLIAAPAVEEPDDIDQMGGQPAAGMRVLIVDDVPTNLMVAATYMRALGAQVDEAMNADTALELIRNQAFNLVLLDIHMPGNNGLWVLERLANGKGRVPPIVMITAGATEREIERARNLGARDVLVKPLTPRMLEGLVRDLAA
ncbi:ATP-binding protein [Pontivivens insulae]|uniref:histidine kinase n=1 Tax=Pontivivens insulae TaxID=1639689 RepID=A0A2R8ABZ6_9RHOB|nr:ATP-binding protein [Pontivivens insulae]RED11071.1 signal transduction histidine kinase [Pontivivens insulae]SPF29754.1 Aerobic respiration control sensor protein ArcB [Pontivivens insulae]